MSGSGMRRKIRKRKSKAENSRMKLTVFGGIILLAIFLGFLTARFVIGPMIGYNADESPVQLKQNEAAESPKDKDGESAEGASASAASDTRTEEETNSDSNSGIEAADATESEMPQEGYALQFGAFSTKEAAEKLSEALRIKGIETKIIETDNAFKVISPVLEDRTAALEALEESKEKNAEDVFITSFSQ